MAGQSEGPQDTRYIEGEETLPQPVAPHEGTLQPGAIVENRYRILGILGMGGMGNVYQARDLRFPNVTKLCAVKEMINMATDPALREQTLRNFEREADILATLSHPAVPQIYDYFSFGDRAYLVLEFIQGKDLEAILNSTEKFLPAERIRKWAVEICEVLTYLHNHEPAIIFRDMKPSNVMIDHMGYVRLIDFGIAKNFQVGDKRHTMIGTEGYSPPEQYRGEVSPQSDIYALGATLHHMLTRRDPRLEPPFSFDTRSIREINPNVPEELANIVERALNYEPGDRYPSIEAMRQALEALDPNQANHFPGAAHASKPGLDERHLGDAAFRVGSGSVLEVWSFEVEDEIRSSPLVVDGVVYFGAYDNNLWALDAKKGSLIWKYATEGGIGSSPSYAQGLIFIGSNDRTMYAIEARTGRISWTFVTQGRIYGSPRSAMDHVFFGSDDSQFYALRLGNGRLTWSIPAGAPVRCRPAVSSDYIFFGSEEGDFYAVNPTGHVRWRFKARRAITSSPLIHENIVYFGSRDGTMYALDTDNGFTIWRFRAERGIASSPAFYKGTIYCGCADGRMYAIDALHGNEKWHFETEGQVSSSPLVYQDVVYVGSLDGHLYCLNAETGDLQWKFCSQGAIISSPTADDGLVYVGSTDKHLYALKA
jgi:outer membrane protein assembly factor BamB/tRNA A-37 threonylcarbamoyl transferase component Bud32